MVNICEREESCMPVEILRKKQLRMKMRMDWGGCPRYNKLGGSTSTMMSVKSKSRKIFPGWLPFRKICQR